MKIPDSVRALIEGGPAGHLTTLNRDGSPQVTVIWVGLDGDEIVAGHFYDYQKLKNVRRDPRVALSMISPTRNAVGLEEYAVLYGRARVIEGGAFEVIRRLADVYIEPVSAFPPNNLPNGYTLRIEVDRIAGIGPWAELPKNLRVDHR